MATNPPNRGGRKPAVTKQGNKGPIVGNRTSFTGNVRPWHLSQGSNGTTRSKWATKTAGSSPSKSKGGWYLGRKGR